MRVNLKRLINKKEIYSIIEAFGPAVVIGEGADKVLYPKNETIGELAKNSGFPIQVAGESVGWVSGGEHGRTIAALLSYLVDGEQKIRELAQETLDKYKEITLLYKLVENLTLNLEPEGIAQMVITEVQSLLGVDNASVMLLNEEKGLLEILSANGVENYSKMIFQPGQGIAGHVLQSGKPEIINDVLTDPRYVPGSLDLSSLMCAPLKVKNRVIGVINVSREKPFNAGELNILNTLASQVAFALENSKLNSVREIFGRYLSDEVVNTLLSNPGALKLGGEMKEITVLMSDLRGFTSLAEGIPPENIITMINNYLHIMVQIIDKYKGTIIEFIGDAIMVIFGAPIWSPEQATSAVACALEMQLAMGEVNEWNRVHSLPEISMGIGINSGPVIVGNIGSEKRTKYGCVGANVNLTSRIESYTVGGQILISESTMFRVDPPLSIQSIQTVHPKGVKGPIALYDIKGLGHPYHITLAPTNQELISLAKVIPILVAVFEEKHCTAGQVPGLLHRLSWNDVEITANIRINPESILQITLLDTQEKLKIGEIYAQVRPGGNINGSVLLQLRSFSPEGVRLWQSILGNKP